MTKTIIDTGRLRLRQIEKSDFQSWHEILSDPETMRYYPAPFGESDTRRWIKWTLDNYCKHGFGLWAVELADEKCFVGDCGLTLQNIYGDGNLYPEIGFHIAKEYRRRGYAGEAARACLKWAFERTDYNEIFCYQKADNIPSQRTAESIGMTQRREYGEPGERTSVYSITRSEYFGK